MSQNKQQNPENTDGTKEEYFHFLNELRESGETNMFGAVPYLQDTFGVDRQTARDVLANWMESFQKDGS